MLLVKSTCSPRFDHKKVRSLLLFIFCTNLVPKQISLQQEPDDEANTCGVFNSIGFNDLTPIDVVVKNPDTNLACIKARFSLAIKVESMVPLDDDDDDEDGQVVGRQAKLSDGQLEKIIKGDSFLLQVADDAAAEGKAPPKVKKVREKKTVLGYLPLEHVIQIEESCPETIKPAPRPHASDDKEAAAAAKQPESENEKDKSKTTKRDESDNKLEHSDDLEMIVTFECGKLAFTFQRNDTRTFLSSIRGLVKLDQRVVREFIAQRPMLITSDLDHHFKYDDLIVIDSESKSQAYILSANLYYTEIETFRSTTSRDFIRPPDEKSKPFLDDEES